MSIKFVNDMVRLRRETGALAPKPQDVADPRRIWIGKRQPFTARHLRRLAFIDETSVKTNMATTTGWAPRGQRLTDHAPFEHWRTQTFIGALHHDRLDAAWVVEGAMNSEMFDLYWCRRYGPATWLFSTTCRATRSPGAARVLHDIGAWVLFLPPYSRDLNPIEMAFSKLDALLKKAAARTYDQLWQAVGHACELFTDKECFNFFKAAGYHAE